MITKISATELARAKELESLGIPLDGEVLEKSQRDCRGLWMDQDPNSVETSIFDLRSGGTGVCISLCVSNDFDRVIRLDAVRLEIPWCQEIRWLKDALRNVPRQLYYSFPEPDRQRFDHDVVLNHRFGRKGDLLPGDCLDGFLLGIADEPIPARYVERQELKAQLSVFDGQRNRYELDVRFLVRREPERHQQQKVAEGMVAPTPTTRRREITLLPVEGESIKPKKVA